MALAHHCGSMSVVLAELYSLLYLNRHEIYRAILIVVIALVSCANASDNGNFPSCRHTAVADLSRLN